MTTEELRRGPKPPIAAGPDVNALLEELRQKDLLLAEKDEALRLKDEQIEQQEEHAIHLSQQILEYSRSASRRNVVVPATYIESHVSPQDKLYDPYDNQGRIQREVQGKVIADAVATALARERKRA